MGRDVVRPALTVFGNSEHGNADGGGQWVERWPGQKEAGQRLQGPCSGQVAGAGWLSYSLRNEAHDI